MANVYVPFPKCKLKVMVKVTMTNNNYLRAPTFSVGVPYITRAFGLTRTVCSGCEIQVKEIPC